MFIKKLSLILLAVFTLGSLTANAQLKISSDSYTTLSTPIEMEKPHTVYEIFWFGCPHCNSLRPFVKDWQENSKAENVTFEYIPAVVGSPKWDIPAQSFYTMKALDRMDLVDPYFDAIHKDREYALIGDYDTIKAFFAKHNVSGEDFEKAWSSQAVKDDLDYARTFFNEAEVSGVPNFVINGKYVVPGQTDKRVFDDVINTLAAFSD